MKKLVFLFSILMSMALVINAQDEAGMDDNGSKEKVILPETGDIGISFNAIPLLDFALNAVNIMNNTGTTAGHPGHYAGDASMIMGRYFLDKSTAVRARFAWNSTNTKNVDIYEDPLTPNVAEPAEVEDVTVTKNSTILLGGGLEMRRGSGRLQGFYGGELLIGLNRTTNKYEYGWEYNQTAVDSAGLAIGNERMLSSKSRLGVTLGVRGFVGVEYYFAPKMSIGAEFGWLIAWTKTPRSIAEYEMWEDPNNDGVGSQATEERENMTSTVPDGTYEKSRTIMTAVDDGINSALAPSGALTLTIHF